MTTPAPEQPVPPCVVHEDDDLLVVNKPPGWNTHAPSPYAGEGIYDWLKAREPRWSRLAIMHRLDKDTSGLLVFGKTPEANRSLTAQFTNRQVRKQYTLVTDRPVPRETFSVLSAIVRSGDQYLARPLTSGGDRAETHFRVLRRDGAQTWLLAEPVTGRTHQIRVHAAAEGLPILGDRLYGGSPGARLALHATALEFEHPTSAETVRLTAQPDFVTPAGRLLRAALIEPALTDAFRQVHGAADGWPGIYGERLGDWLLLAGEQEPAGNEVAVLAVSPGAMPPVRGVYFRQLLRQVARTPVAEAAPRLVAGDAAPARFPVCEEGVRYELSMAEGYSVGLFLDQRDNRRRLLSGHVAADFPLYGAPEREVPEVLNCFAYTCAFSVCAALGGARVTSLDLSRKYLDWGRRNFELNGVDPAAHDFIYGDVFDWLKRLARKSRTFELIILDPPTFSRSPGHGDFRCETDYGRLVSLALSLLRPDGVLLASANMARLLPEPFIAQVHEAIRAAGRQVVREHYAPQPPDFPVTREEPAYLKTLWLRIS